jgi:hypothetical protein
VRWAERVAAAAPDFDVRYRGARQPGPATNAYLTRIDGKWFAAQFDRASGKLVTAFVPNKGQLSAMLSQLFGK